MKDPLLTPFGEEQCVALRDTFPYHSNASLVIASPLRRTIYTAILSFAPSLANGRCRPNIIALPEIQETSDFPCDTGSDLGTLRQEIRDKNLPVNLSLVKERWNDKSLDGKWAPSGEALTKRAAEARRYVRDRVLELQKSGEKDPEIVVVTHGGFLHHFTQDWEDSKTYNGTGWHNTEYRSFNFVNLDHCSSRHTINGTSIYSHTVDDYDNAALRETAESRDRRGKIEPQHGRDKQSELFNAAVQGWEDHGQPNGDKVGKKEGDDVNAKGKGEVEDTELAGLARVLTKDSENTDTKDGEAPATNRRAEAAADAEIGRRRRQSSNVTKVAA